MVISTGQMAPNFSLYDQNGNQVELLSYRGKPVVLAFFPAAFTGVCQKEMCEFRDSITSFVNMNAQVLAISVDGRFSNAEFAKQNKLNFPVLSDYTHSTIKDYGVEFHNLAGMEGYVVARRSVFVIDATGKIVWSWVSTQPTQEPEYSEISKAVESLK